MINIFDKVESFFTSINAYIDYNLIFIIFLALFIFIILVVIISTSHAYEAKLIKAIDMFNNYFIDNPQINEDNLVQFNNRMKQRKVPKQLRKQWQQYVLYRENNASEYMSYEACVSNPIKNSTFRRDITTMNILAYMLAFLCFLFNIYRAVGDIVTILQKCLLCPILILILNYIITIFLDLRHNAIVSDLNSNYQYFEVNIDKATQTLPEYVDYEVLFDHNEIKRGIPILYAYLQKRAEEEQKELELARLKNVEHEKFNFDEAGVASSLVLDRAMHEAENYIAERKKYLQDIEMINADITQEEINFREITKEYQRQMQVSKESFENFKQQLNEATSTIQTNYLKKQQQQELDRQRNLERDYDTATDRNKKVLSDYQAELKSVEDEIKKARTALENAMMSEFDTYKDKVYEEANKLAKEREAKKVDGLKTKISELTKQLEEKQDASTIQPDETQEEEDLYKSEPQIDDIEENNAPLYEEPNSEETFDQFDNEPQYDEQDSSYDENYASDAYEEDAYDSQTSEGEEAQDNFDGQYEDDGYDDYNYDGQYADENQNIKPQDLDEENEQFDNSVDATKVFNVEDKPKKKVGRPKKKATKTATKRAVGRPKKIDESAKTEEKKVVKRGRPKKVEKEAKAAPKRGRPKKAHASTAKISASTKTRGRPKKEEAKSENKTATRGRPKKEINETGTNKSVAKKATGTKTISKKSQIEKAAPKRGRPKKEVNSPGKAVSSKTAKAGSNKTSKSSSKATKHTSSETGRPASTSTAQKAQPKKGRGRPPKNKVSDEISDLDAYIDQINNEIARENAKLENAKKNLEKKAKIRKKK